jgi:hypothetical protein
VVEVADCVAHVVVDQVGVEGDGGRGAGACGGDDLGARVNDVSGGPNSGDAGAAGVVDGDPAVGVGVAAEAVEEEFETKRGGTNSASRGMTQSSRICTPRRWPASSMTSCSMVPSTTPMARASSWVRSVAVRMSGGVK